MSKFIVIMALSENYRRAGLVFGTKPTEYKADDFADGVLDILYADPNLTIKNAPQLVDSDLIKINEDLAAEIETLSEDNDKRDSQIAVLLKKNEDLTSLLEKSAEDYKALDEAHSQLIASKQPTTKQAKK